MKTKFILIAAVLLGIVCPGPAEAQFKIGGRKINTGKLLNAAADAATAVTLSDADIARLSRESVEWMDANNPVAEDDNEYMIRLKRLTEGITDAEGLPLNFKVYLVIDVNAFACGDGSIRVFSSLMDLMDDDELMAIIGHEIGHVVHADVKHAMKNAYLASAARNAAGAAEGSTVAKLSESQLGDLATAFTDAQFSQKQEYEADKYGFRFCVEHGFSPYGMAASLEKLVELSQGAKASTVQKMFSSHPDSEKRAAAVRYRAAVSIYYYLPAGNARIARRSADDESPRRIDENIRALQELLRHDALYHALYHRLAYLLLRNHIVGGRKNGNMFQVCVYLSRQRFRLHNPIDFVPEKFHPNQIIAALRGTDFQHVTPHAEATPV